MITTTTASSSSVVAWHWASAEAGVLIPVPVDAQRLSIDAHRHHRGPYTLANQLLAAVVPDAWAQDPALVARHEIEILTACPELQDVFPSRLSTLTSLAVPEEHTRFYAAARTQRVAHGLCDFLRAHLTRRGVSLTLDVTGLVHADRTDRELLATLVRRVPGELLHVLLRLDGPDLPPPLSEVAGRQLAFVEATTISPGGEVSDQLSLARAYVAGDCTSPVPTQVAAYAALSAGERCRLHDERAAELARRDEPSLVRGALALHRERGGDPTGAGVATLTEAMRQCLELGFYPGTVELGMRLRQQVTFVSHPTEARKAVGALAMALMMTGAPDRAEALFREALQDSTEPTLHLLAYYGSAMIATRYAAPGDLDHAAARRWLNSALALAGLWPEPDKRAFMTAFNRNGLALVEVHCGNLPAALALVEEALEIMSTQVELDRHALHRSVLEHNRAQVLAGLGRVEEAVAALTTVIDADPHHSEYHLDRGSLLRRLGRLPEALADYEEALRCSPPYVEAVVNRAAVLVELGDLERALLDYDYTVDLDPDYVDAYLNRGSVLLELGRVAEADRDASIALRLSPASAEVHCLAGQVAAAADRPTAVAHFDRAIALDGRLVAAWSGRAAVAYALGRVDDAIADLGVAMTLSDDPTLAFNRGLAHASREAWEEARCDFTVAAQDEELEPEALLERARCQLAMRRFGAAQSDLRRVVELGGTGLQDQARELLQDIRSEEVSQDDIAQVSPEAA